MAPEPAAATQPMQCVILSGGLGTRLGELGRRRPKHLVEVLGRPFAHRQLAWLASEGVTDVVECIGHLGEQISDSIGDGTAFGLTVTYSSDTVSVDDDPAAPQNVTPDDGARPGTGGALMLAHRRGLLQPNFLVLYGDSWLRLDLGEVWRHAARSTVPATMCVLDNSTGREASNVILDGGLVRYRKGDSTGVTHIDYGVSVLSRSLLDDVVGEPIGVDLADLMDDWSHRDLVDAFEAHQPYDEVGTPEGVKRLEAALLATGQTV